MDALGELQTKWNFLMPHLDERQRRLMAAAEARVLGYGGIALVAEASGLSRTTVHKALEELEAEPLSDGRVRRLGAGRKRVQDKNPALLVALEQLIDPTTRGDPMSPLRWTCKSTRQLALALSEQGHAISHTVVSELLQELGYSLQANAKTVEGKQHPDRDAQFQYINRQTKRQLRRKTPAISVDAKKKELVGQYKGGAKEWQPKGEPEPVKTHDFPDPNVGKALPYGVYDMARNEGWVNVGNDHDTASFAVESIRRWWRCMGRKSYPDANSLLVCADAGGSNGYRPRLWKLELQHLADETGLKITVCHFPSGTSKWNKIEHRLFAHITMNWRGCPLVSHEVVVNLISATSTRSGLTVKAKLDTSEYPLKVKVTDEEFNNINLKRHRFHGEWNYTISPRT
jgi:transposase